MGNIEETKKMGKDTGPMKKAEVPIIIKEKENKIPISNRTTTQPLFKA